MQLALSAIVTRSRNAVCAGSKVNVAVPKHAKPVVHLHISPSLSGMAVLC
jgi:hypothetical protein